MYAVKPNGSCRVYSELNPLEDDEILYDDLPQFVLDLVQAYLRGE
jgi:hypothetical protein